MRLNAKSIVAIVAGTAILMALTACEKPPHPSTLPVSHWLKDENACVRKTAQAILDSGRPWPNTVWRRTENNHNVIASADMWVADQLYEFTEPGIFIGQNDWVPAHHPFKFTSITPGSVEDVLGIPKRKFKDWRVGGTIYGNIFCEIDRPPNTWRENRIGPNHTVESIQKIQRDLTEYKLFEVVERADINMTEVLAEATNPRHPANPARQSAVYLPNGAQIHQTINGVLYTKPIWCNRKYDPDAALEVTDKCGTWIWLAPGIRIGFEVYQQYLPLLPALHDHMLQKLESSRRK